ncbi:MAG: STAS domain-containing protein [Bryobacteraceae bacterium]|jgi:anti-anti-sigma factor
MDELKIERSAGSTADVSILALKGPLTISTLFDFQTALREPGLTTTIIDFSGVPYIDSAGLGVVLSHWAHTQRIGAKFAVVAMSEKVRVLLAMTKVDTLLPIFPTAADAERSFANGASAA